MSATPEPANAAQGSLPSGTVTFAFTDIEGSTVRWERDPAAMQLAVRRHDALVRAAIVSHGGHVFKTIGDAFCAAFTRPEDALAALLAAQRALAAEDFSAVDGIRVRAAIHTGTADERDADYFGPAVNRVARLLSIAHGGQVLVSGAAAATIATGLPQQASLRDLGDHRLKDLSQPEHVYQVLAPDLRAEFPPLRSLDALQTNLPAETTTFIGRELEIAEITGLLETNRAVTLLGSGGIGKTRTSLHVASNLIGKYRDGVWFVELASLADGALIPSTVAAELGVAFASSGDPVEGLAGALASKQALILFDNCEHVIEAAARTIGAIIRGCPNVKILSSSRHGLGVASETIYRLPPLEIPREPNAESFAASDVPKYPALALFVERARAASRTFELTDENAFTIAEICTRLDGIPLAIELAAARVKMLGPEQLHDRLDERFRLLTGGGRDVLPRQQTLRALIDWSYDLLDDRERTLFGRLSVFVDGFTLDAAGGVATDAEIDELDAFDLLASLVDKSLVLAELDGAEMRYRLLESTGAYAREKLVAAGGSERIASRHVSWYRDLFVSAADAYDASAHIGDVGDLLVAELGNVRAAIDTSLTGIELGAGAELFLATGQVWSDLGFEREGQSRATALIERLAGAEPLLVARLSVAVARFTSSFGQGSQAVEAATLAVARAREAEDASTLLEALIVYSWNVAAAMRYDDADAALSEAESLRVRSPRVRLALLNTRAFVSYHGDDLDAAVRLFGELRDAHRALGNFSRARMVTLALAEASHGCGDTSQAIALVREVLLGIEKRRHRVFRAGLLSNLAGYLTVVDDRSGAREASREAIEELGSYEPEAALVINAMLHLALVTALDGALEAAATMIGYVDAANERHGFRRELTETRSLDRVSAILREALEPDELERFLALGAALSPERAVRYALDV